MIHANLEFIENAKMMPKEMQTRLRSKVFSLGRICNKLGRSAALEIDIILCFESEKMLGRRKFWVKNWLGSKKLIKVKINFGHEILMKKIWV